MGFFYSADKPARLVGPSNSSVDLLHRSGCKACPLNNAKCRNPKMEPSGSGDVYILGTTPTIAADRVGKPMTGPGKDAFLAQVPRKWKGNLRYSNIVRTPAGRDVTSVMIECCRPSVIADIEEAQPKAIIGFGDDVLKWMLNQTGIRKWTGRHIPVKIGEHVCWFFPLSDPVEVLKTKRFEWAESEEQFAWALQVANAFALIDELPEAPAPHTREQARAGITTIDGSNGDEDLDLLQSMLDDFAEEEACGFDYETNRKRGYNKGAKILTAAISGAKETLALALDHSRAMWGAKHRQIAHDMLADWLLKAKCRKISHSLHFELEWSALKYSRKIVWRSRWEDTVTQAWLLDERQSMGKPDALSLEFLCIQYFGLNIKAMNVLDTADLDDAPLDIVLQYNGIDAKYHRFLYREQLERIAEEGLEVQYEHMLRRIHACVLTQIKGVPISQKRVRNFKRYYEENLALILADIHATDAAKAYKRKFGKTFDPGNPKETLKLITQVLQEDATNKKEKQSAGLEVLDRIDDPIAPLILEWRSDEKALGTYVLPVYEGDAKQLRSEHLYEDGLIHPTISTTRTDTSRTASDKPNQQNWPKRKKSKVVRSQVEPEPDERVVSFDFAGIQARNIAMESLDPKLIDSFWTGYDPHADWTRWLAERAGTDWRLVAAMGSTKSFYKDKEVFKNARGIIKNSFVFPTFFGAQPRSIGINLDIDIDTITDMQAELFDDFPKVKIWQDGIKEHYAAHGWITGLSGIIHRAPRSPNQLINAPIQADEAWIVLDCMDCISQMAEDNWLLQPNMEIHDDLTFIWPKKLIDMLAPIVITAMLTVRYKWAHVVPIEVEMSVGTNWSTLEEVGKFRSDTWKERGYRREDYA